MKFENAEFSDQYDIGIIGCGAAGLYLANMIAMEREDLSIAIFERNKTGGKKLRLSGNGRCNFTNSTQSVDCYYAKESQKAYAILQAHPYTDCLDFYAKCKIAYYEREGYYYPLTGSADTVTDALLRVANTPFTDLFYDTCIHKISRVEHGFHLTDEKGRSFSCSNLVIAAGGLALPSSGSHGDAYFWLKNMGLTIHDRFPALVPLIYNDRALDGMAGCRIKAAVRYHGRVEAGEIQFVKGHLSGIPVLSISHHVSADCSAGKAVSLEMDFLHFIEPFCISCVIQAAEQEQMTVEDLLSGLFCLPLIEFLCEKAGLSPHEAADKAKAEALIHQARHTMISIRACAPYDKAQITAGGVSLDSLDPHMMAIDVEGLYCIGEIVDVDGICGGYNLQWAYSSAAACAERLIHL